MRRPPRALTETTPRLRRLLPLAPAAAGVVAAAGLIVALVLAPDVAWLPAAALIGSLAALAGGLAGRLRRASEERDRARSAAESLEGSRDRLAAILDGLTDGVTVQDRDGRLVYANRAAARVLGFDDAETLLRAPIAEVMARYEILDEEGRPFPLERLPGRAVLAGEGAPGVTLRYRDRETGAERWSFVRAARVRDGSGAPLMAASVFQDITEERWNREASRLLAGISQELLASSLDHESTLRRLAELVVPRLADIAAVYLVEQGEPRRVEVVHADPEAQVVVRRLAEETSDVPAAEHPVRRVIETGEPRLVEEIDERDLTASTANTEAVLGLDMGSAMIVPLRAGDRTLGALALVTVGDRRRYEQQDLAVATDLAGRAAMAIDNARLHEEERSARRAAEGTAAGLARLQRITTGLAASTSVEEVADAVLSQAFDAFGASSGSLAVREGRMLRLVGTTGIQPDEAEHWRSFSVDAPVPLAEAVRSRSPVLIAEPQELASRYPHLVGPTSPSEGKAWVALPLVRDGEATGVLGLTFSEPRSFPEGEERFLQIVSQECAQALERARLYEAERAARAEAVRQQERLNFLAEASEILAGSLRYERTLEHLLELCVPRLADWCIVDVAESDGSIEQLAVAHVDPGKTELIRELRSRYPPDLRDHPILRVVRTGSPEVMPEITEEELAAGAEDEEHLRILRSLGVHGHMVVPLPARGGILGAISFVSGDSGRRYTHADLALAEDLARRAALALDNARLYRERSRVARALQESLLPSRLPTIPGVELAARYRPAGEGSDIGGDFYDVFEVAPDRWAVVIGDVAGRGPEAGALTALTRYTIRTAWLEAEREPSDILRILNDAILREEGDRFCTLALVLLDLSRRPVAVTVASGGHPPPLLLRADGFVEPMRVSGMLLGAFSYPNLGQAEIEAQAGDAVVLYTDGIVDPGRESSVPVEERLVEMLKLCVGLDAELIANRIQRHVSMFEGAGANDDAALVVLRLSDGPAFT